MPRWTAGITVDVGGPLSGPARAAMVAHLSSRYGGRLDATGERTASVTLTVEAEGLDGAVSAAVLAVEDAHDAGYQTVPHVNSLTVREEVGDARTGR